MQSALASGIVPTTVFRCSSSPSSYSFVRLRLGLFAVPDYRQLAVEWYVNIAIFGKETVTIVSNNEVQLDTTVNMKQPTRSETNDQIDTIDVTIETTKINVICKMQQELVRHDRRTEVNLPTTIACLWFAICQRATRQLTQPVSSYMFKYLFIVNVLLVVVSTNLLVSVNCLLDDADENKCFSCMRNVTQLMGVDGSKRCEEYLCGPYQISYRYWTEAGKPGMRQDAKDFERCVRDRNCAEQTIKAYFRKYKRDCNNDGQINCLDMASLHKGGPSSCSTDWFYKSRYWSAFNRTMCSPSNRALEEANKSSSQPSSSGDIAPKRPMKSNETLTPECLDCICEAVSGCNLSNTNCSGGTVCGPYSISQAYWKDGKLI